MEDQKKRAVREAGIGALRDALARLPAVMEKYKADAFLVTLSAVRQGAYVFAHDQSGTIILAFNRDIFTEEDLFAFDGIFAGVRLSPETVAALARGQERKRQMGQDVVHIEGYMIIPPDGTGTA